MDPEQELELARQALAKGSDPAKVRALYKQRTGQDFPDAPLPEQPYATPLPRGTRALDLLQRFSQGVTMGYGDELAGVAAMVPGGLSPREAIDSSRRATARATERQGMLGSVAEGVGGLASGALLAAAGAPLLARNPVLASAALGAIGAGGYASGKATGGVMDRARAAAVPAAVGGAIGMAAPLVGNALLRRAPGRGERVATALRETSGVTDDINVTRQRVADMVEQVRADSYRPFSQMPKVDASQVLAQGVPDDIARLLPKGQVGFEDLQGIRATLREQGNHMGAEMLSDVMEKMYPGTRAADKAYFAAQEIQRAQDLGGKVASKSGADVEWAARGLSQPQQEPFRQMLVQRVKEALTLRDEQAGAMLNRLLDQGPEGARRVRQLFPAGQQGDAAFREFQRIVALERSAIAVGKAFKNIIRPLLLVGTGAGVAGLLK